MMRSVPSTNKEDRRRGRPAGKNRIPLSREERKARNAQYERERRNETAEVMTQLAEAALCDPQVSNAELLATVINRIQMASQRSPTEIEDLKRINNNLENQIAMLESRLGDDFHLYEAELNTLETEQSESQPESSGTSSDARAESTKRPRKYRKLSKSNSIHNRGRIGKKKIRMNSESSTSDWTESDTTSHGNQADQESQSTSSSEASQTEAYEVKEETNEQQYEGYQVESQVEQEVEQNPTLTEPVEVDNGLPDHEEALGPLTEDIRGVLSDLLNDNEFLELGLQEANEFSNWPVNFEDVFAGY